MDKKQKLLDLIDKAGKGSIEAATEIAVGYYKGDFGEKNPAKAKKWASFKALIPKLSTPISFYYRNGENS